MRIAIIASGSRGDVEPYVALGKGLQAAGHVVRLVTHQDFESLVAAHGVDFWPVKGSVQDVAQSMAALIEDGNFLAILAQMGKEAQRGAFSLTTASLAACQGMELIVAGVGGVFVGIAVAEKLGLPVLQAYYIPFTPTNAYPAFVVPRPPALLGALPNRPSYQVTRQMMWQAFRSADKSARREILDLAAAPFFGPFNAEPVRGQPILYGYSPAVISPPADWGADVHVTGYWFLDPAEDWTPDPALADFLAAGPPPVYVGFGSMSNRNPEATANLIVDALARTKQRGIIHAGWSGLQPADLPASVLMIEEAPFSWLFPRVAAVVHHGGAGTTSAGLRAGVPSIVVPFFGDQPFCGQRVADLGVGPAPIPRKKLTAERLAGAIQVAVTDKTIHGRAAELGEKIRAEDGVANAVAVVEQMTIRD